MSNLTLIVGSLAALAVAGTVVSVQLANAQVTTKPLGGGAQVMTCPAGWARTPAPKGYTCHINFNAACDAGDFSAVPTVEKTGGGATWRVAYLCGKP